MTRMKSLAALLTLSASIIGCSAVRAPIKGRLDPYDTQQIHFATESLRRDTAVGTPQLSRDNAGLLFVTIPIRSAIDKNLYVDYRVTFVDKNNQPVFTTSWFTKTLEANTPDRITVNSTNPRTTDFQVDFRYAR